MKSIHAEIHAKAREATAKQVFRAVSKQKKPEIAIAIILLAIEQWYEKGVNHGKK